MLDRGDREVKSGAVACSQYHLNAQALSRWKAEFLQRAPRAFNTVEQSTKEQARIAELERMVGRLTLEVEQSEYQGYWDADGQISRFLEEAYMPKRINWSLG